MVDITEVLRLYMQTGTIHPQATADQVDIVKTLRVAFEKLKEGFVEAIRDLCKIKPAGILNETEFILNVSAKLDQKTAQFLLNELISEGRVQRKYGGICA